MCAIYQLELDAADELLCKVRERYGDESAEKYRSAVLYPKSEAPVLGPGGKVALMRWGFPLSGKKSVVFNARAETLASRPLFRACVKNRCIVPASAFYEWGEESGEKRKFLISGDGMLHFAALYKTFTDEDGARKFSFTIVTTAPNGLLASIHSRMPAVVEPGRVGEWLDPSADPSRLLAPYGGSLTLAAAE